MFIGFKELEIKRILVKRKVKKDIVDMKEYVQKEQKKNVRMKGEVDIMRDIVKRKEVKLCKKRNDKKKE